MKRPKEWGLGLKVLELRGVKEDDDSFELAIANDQFPANLAEMVEKSKKIPVTDKILKNAKRKKRTNRKIKTRKDFAPWDWVIEKLVEEGFLPKKISRQALKRLLKNRYPYYPWDEV